MPRYHNGDPVATRLAAVANSTRVEILKMLSQNGSLPFSIMSKQLRSNPSNPTLVHHLTKLLQAGLIQKAIPNDLNSRTYRTYGITLAGRQTLEEFQHFEKLVLT